MHTEGDYLVDDVPEGCGKVSGDPVPTWFVGGYDCVCDGFCQCNLAGRRNGFHHPGRLCSNFFQRSEYDRRFLLVCQCSKVRMEYAREGCNQHSTGDAIAAALSRIAIANCVRRRGHPVGGRLKCESVTPPTSKS